MAPRHKVHFAIFRKCPHRSIRGAMIRGEKWRSEAGYECDLDTMQRILDMDFNIKLG